MAKEYKISCSKRYHSQLVQYGLDYKKAKEKIIQHIKEIEDKLDDKLRGFHTTYTKNNQKYTLAGLATREGDCVKIEATSIWDKEFTLEGVEIRETNIRIIK